RDRHRCGRVRREAHRKRRPSGFSKMKWRSAPKDAAERAAHDRAADRVAHRAADRLAEIADDLASDPIGHRARDLARDQLSGGEAIAAWIVGAEDRTEHAADGLE